ncbi:SucD Succinyl-CoA synthetase alpha subunit [Pyrenophora tritici-repentis]|uniref:Succinyl-CoA ligase protein n=2 Tax=Pyrenophora tritici-repentis TaxID=45151 RepID=A0A2W1EMG7_9PLEO|nr:succinyl-CoA ligase subunit alpha [Pyrenophora tritici-repentis Pt-1C-BFP]KAA8627443.1 Succinyl-CoA ligase subunit alpha [Pyrenophora tritici-repentis]EDU41918.1 succinyl-CoA ligase subunit alpha [Pyrenophora tritici-repentis Pt-1C-BFP]KAF7442523.1 Succinyl-CoA ligase protein [Pyrenophora tritici-repentis]KAG9378030.1 Succinyl-CoA ligase protein [Pyrenophora tritici-repentis]KAI0579913.1 Succinyl-CoA ligase subunit alpha [Pyrenophora tritici-repentis]
MLSQQAHGLRNAICRTKYHGYWTTRSSFSTSLRRNGYDSTIQNLKIGAHTRVIFQGFTGKQATANAKESIQWGTNVVGGVKPNGSGEHLGLPVLPSVRAAMEQLKPDATGIYVAAHQATAAIEEAIKAEVPLIVAVAEHIPLHDMMRIHSMLQSQSKSRLIGANAPGIISAIGRCRIGFQPLPTFSPGHIGIVAKSGTLSYETVGSLTRAGLGQSLCIAVGGDVIAGTNFVDALKVFEHDKDTEAIIVVGELGGTIEEEAADWIINYRRRVKDPKPIAAVIGGFQAPHGKVMGHAGAWVGLGEGTAESKYKALERAGVTMVDHPAKFGGVIKDILAKSGRSEQSAAQQRRSYHTSRFSRRPQVPVTGPTQLHQKHSLHLTAEQSTALLKSHNIHLTLPPEGSPSTHYLGISPHRSNRSPSIIAAPTANPSQLNQRVRRFPFDYRSGPSAGAIADAIAHLQLDAAPPKAKAQVVQLIHNLWTLYTEKEAIDAHVNLALSVDDDELLIYSPYLFFDDAAFKSGKRQAHLHALRDEASISATDQQAEDAGIVYVPLASPVFPTGTRQKGTQTSPSSAAKDGPRNLVGTLVNGAGLALNTIDTLSARLSAPPHATSAANFLDTGGKATSDTIKTSFKLVLSDPRVGVVFVNIFGGLTLCDMIAEGIILAFKELDVKKPVVVRLRGTNEAKGQKVLEDAKLPIHAFDDFEEAVKKVGELANVHAE